MNIIIKAIADELPPDAGALASEAELEGYEHIRRLADEWASGRNRFDQDGEILLGAYESERLVGVGGLSVEFSRRDWLRMRRFYVHPSARRQGTARSVAERLIVHGRHYTNTLTVHAADAGAARFWEKVGFAPLARDGYTHLLEIK
jgi:GNAT superfamily N-acetyltransferase